MTTMETTGTAMNDPCAYVQAQYGVPARIGMRVVVDGKPGIIVKDCGHHLGVNFDADKPGLVKRCHPTWKITYGKMGKIRPMTRSQQRYQDYLNSDGMYDDFRHFLACQSPQSTARVAS